MSFNDSTAFKRTVLTLVLGDLDGYARAVDRHGDETMADTLNAFYHLSTGIITRHHGRVIKFIGDAVHAVFEDAAASDAVRGVVELRDAVAHLAKTRQIDLDFSARVHRGPVIEGLYGPHNQRQYDVIGGAMNDTALMKGGRGIRISAEVFDRLAPPLRARFTQVEPNTYRYHSDTKESDP